MDGQYLIERIGLKKTRKIHVRSDDIRLGGRGKIHIDVAFPVILPTAEMDFAAAVKNGLGGFRSRCRPNNPRPDEGMRHRVVAGSVPIAVQGCAGNDRRGVAGLFQADQGQASAVREGGQ